MTGFKLKHRAFQLPGEEGLLDNICNNDMYRVVNKIVTPCPKECIILVYVEYEDSTDRGEA
jgi:hypothetical protein